MKYISIIFFLALCAPCFAQPDKMDHFMPDPTLIIGGSFQKFNGLNDRISNFQQYKKLPDYTATLEIGWLKEHKRVVSAAGINIASSMSGNHNEKSSSLRSLGAHADIGYDLVKSKMVMLYPLIGIGYEMYQARFFQDNSSVDFNNVAQSPTLQNSIGPVAFTNAFLTYRAGLGFAVHSQKYPGNSIGLQAGYSGSFSSHAWKSNEGQTLSNAPEDKLSKVFVGLVFTCSPMSMMHHDMH